jgi:hypothetical protein
MDTVADKSCGNRVERKRRISGCLTLPQQPSFKQCARLGTSAIASSPLCQLNAISNTVAYFTKLALYLYKGTDVIRVVSKYSRAPVSIDSAYAVYRGPKENWEN